MLYSYFGSKSSLTILDQVIVDVPHHYHCDIRHHYLLDFLCLRSLPIAATYYFLSSMSSQPPSIAATYYFLSSMSSQPQTFLWVAMLSLFSFSILFFGTLERWLQDKNFYSFLLNTRNRLRDWDSNSFLFYTLFWYINSLRLWKLESSIQTIINNVGNDSWPWWLEQNSKRS